MNILLLSTGGKIGGEETFTRNLALSLIKRNHQVTVCPGGEVQKMDLVQHEIPVCEVDITARKPLGLYKAAKEIQQYALDNHIDVIHAQAVGPALMGVMAKKFLKCPIPWIWHNHGITDFAYKHIVKHLDKLDLVISNSDYVFVMLRNHGISLNKSKRIHNGIDLSMFTVSNEERNDNRFNLHKEFNIKESDYVITYVGRLSPEKGVKVLLEAFDRLYRTNKNVTCLLVGDGIQRSEFEQFAKSAQSGNKIVFAGFRKDIKEILSASDVLVLPSHIETFSLTTLQAFSTGTPVVASDVGGTPEQVLSDFNGLLFKDNDTEDLKNKILGILADEEKRLRLSRNARLLSENYLNDERMTEEIETVYKNLIK